MPGILSPAIAATPLTVSGTSNGIVTIASVTGWLAGSQASLADNTTTPPVSVTIVLVDTVNNQLWLRTDFVPSEGWIQDGLSPQLTPPPHLPLASKNPTDMSAWTTGHAATITQVPTFIYASTTDYKKKKKTPPVTHFFTLSLTSPGFTNTRATPAYQTNANGTMTLLMPGVTRLEAAGFYRENALYNSANPAVQGNLLQQTQFIGGNTWGNDNNLDFVSTTSGLTVGAQNAALAPDGTMTATVLTTGTGSGQHRIYIPASTSCFSVYVKSGAGLSARYVTLGDSTGSVIFGSIDLQTGLYVPGLEDVGAVDTLANGWFRLRVVDQVSPTGYYTIFVGETAIALTGYTSVGGYSVQLWGAQAEGSGSFCTSYIPFGTQTITHSAETGTVDGNNLTTTFGQPDVFGGATGSLLTTVAGIGASRCYYSGGSSPSATDPSVSQCYVKPSLSTARYLTIGDASQSNYYASFDLSSGTPVFVNGAGFSINITSATVTPAADGWFLCAAVSTFGTTSSIFWTVFVGETAPAISSPTNVGGFTLTYCCPQVSSGTVSCPYYASIAAISVGARATDHITFANPLHGLDPANWSFGGVLTPIDTWANVFNAAATFPLWFQGGAQTFPNSWRHIVPCVGVTSAELDVYDHLGGTATVVNTNVVSGSTPVTTACFSKVGVISMTPGTPGTPTFTNDTLVQPVTITLGYDVDPFNFQGWMKTVWMDKT